MSSSVARSSAPFLVALPSSVPVDVINDPASSVSSPQASSVSKEETGFPVDVVSASYAAGAAPVAAC